MQPIRVLVRPVGHWLNASANSSSLKTFGNKVLEFSEATMPPQALPIWEDSTGGMTPSEMSTRGIFWKIVLGMNVIALPLSACLWHTFLGGAGKGNSGAAARDPIAAGFIVVAVFGIGSFNSLAALCCLAVLAAAEYANVPHYSPASAFSTILDVARHWTPQRFAGRVKEVQERILSSQVCQLVSGWSPPFQTLVLFICYHVIHKLFLYSLVDVSVAYGYISMASGFNWELWYWWTRWIFVFVNSTAATKYWCYYKDRPPEPLASSVIDVTVLLCPGIGTDISLAKSWIFAGLTFHTAQCGTDPNMIYRLGVLGSVSIVSICLPMIENLRTSSDVDLASFVASHWPIACATPATSHMTSADTTPASQLSLRETAISAAIRYAIPQVTEPCYKTVLWHDSVEGVCELIFLFAVGGSPFIAFALFTSFGKILFIPVIRRILAEYIEASGDADMLLAYEKCHGHNKFSRQRGGMHLAADSANRWRFSLRMFDALQTLGADPTQKANTGQTPLHVAAETGHSEAAGYLLSKVGPDALAEPGAAGMTPLHAATAQQHGAIMVDELLRFAKDTLALQKVLVHPNNDGRVPLGEAARNGNAAACLSLLEARADRKMGDLHHQKSPLQVALECGHPAGLLKGSGYEVQDMKEAGFSLASFKETFSATELDGVFSLAELKDGGFNAADLKPAFGVRALKDCGFEATDLKEAHFGLEELKSCGFKAEQLKDAFDISELKEGGFGVIDLKPFFTPLQLKEAGFESAKFLESQLSDLKGQGLGVAELREAFTLKELKDGGYTSKDFCLADVMRSEQEHQAGFTSDETMRGLEEAKATGWTFAAANARNRAKR